jgi:hypothetical protein
MATWVSPTLGFFPSGYEKARMAKDGMRGSWLDSQQLRICRPRLSCFPRLHALNWAVRCIRQNSLWHNSTCLHPLWWLVLKEVVSKIRLMGERQRGGRHGMQIVTHNFHA